MAVFDVLFGWRKASKCKKWIRRVQSRLRILRNKRDAIVRQSRSDVSRLVEMGYLDIAAQRAEQLLIDKSVLELYDLMNHFCEFIITNLSYIRRHRECPNDINEAVSSLIFASARCGELPELRRIRELFKERYGESFALTAVNLLPGNLVNSKIREQLSSKSTGDQPRIPCRSELHEQIEEMAERQTTCLDIVPISPATIVDPEEETAIVPISSESIVNLEKVSLRSERMVYHDDVEELQSRPEQYEGPDQRLFKFKPAIVRRRPPRGSEYAAYCKTWNGNARKHLNRPPMEARARGFRGEPDVLPDQSLDTDASTSSLLLPSYSTQTVQPEGDEGRSRWRSNSSPSQPSHVHPKLPDYEELAARFSALKEVYIGTITRS